MIYQPQEACAGCEVFEVCPFNAKMVEEKTAHEVALAISQDGLSE